MVQRTSLLYRQLRRTKSAPQFWRTKLEANHSDPYKLWKLVDDLLGRGRVPASSAIDGEVFSRFIAEKVAKVRSSTADAPTPTFTRAPPGVSFRQFQHLTTDIINAVRRLPDKSSAADLIPTSVLKWIADLVLFIIELFNRSLSTDQFPAAFGRRLSLQL